MSQPTVSVVMCTYNGAKYLRQQLDSILQQTYPLLEVIVQDDQSTDDTLQVLREYADRYPQLVKVFVRAQRTGINDNFFTAIDRACGDYFAISDQDDVWASDKIARQVAQLEASGNWVSSHCSPKYDGQTPTDQIPYDHRMPNFGLERLMYNGPLFGHTLLVRRSFYEWFRSQVSDEQMRECGHSICYDGLISFTASAYGKVDYLVVPLTFHRFHQTSQSYNEHRDNSQHNVSNAIHMVWGCLSPRKRRLARPILSARWRRVYDFWHLFPDAPCVEPAFRLIRSFLDRTPRGYVQFLWYSVKYRDRIFFCRSKGLTQLVRALLNRITIYDRYIQYIDHPLTDWTRVPEVK